MNKNSGRSKTLSRRKSQVYLLKGVIRCADCGMPLWAQTYNNGIRYYREQRSTRSHGECPSRGGTVQCHIPDEQIGRIIEALELEPKWLDRVLSRISAHDEIARVREERDLVSDRLRRLGTAYVDGLFPEPEYRQQKHALESQLESLVIPEVDSAEEAGRLV